MFSKKRWAKTTKAQCVALPEPPTMEILTAYGREIMAAPPGAEIEFSWPSNGETFKIELWYNRHVSAPIWKLYRHYGDKDELIWEHASNDIKGFYNLLFLHTGRFEQDIKVGATPASHKEGATAAASDTLTRNLHNMLVGVQNSEIQAAPTIHDASKAIEKAQPSTRTAAVSTATAELPQPANLSASTIEREYKALQAPGLYHPVDLTLGRGLRQSLLVSEVGTLTYPAFLYLLEQEYYKAISGSTHLTIALFKNLGLTKADGSRLPSSLTKSATQEALTQVKARLRKTDILAEFDTDTFAFVLPETDNMGARLFLQKIAKVFGNPMLAPVPGNQGLKVVFSLASLDERLQTLPLLIGAAEQALSYAEQSDREIVSYEDCLDIFASQAYQDRARPRSKNINLDEMHSLVAQLQSRELGIFTYPAWLVCLEREYHRSLRQQKVLLTLLLRMRLHDLSGTNPQNMLPPDALHEAFRRIDRVKRKGDIIGNFTHGDYAVLHPNSTVRGMETLTAKIRQSILESPLAGDYDHRTLKVGINICTVQGHASQPDGLTLRQIVNSS